MNTCYENTSPAEIECLIQYMGELGVHFEVYRNDELTIEEVKRYSSLGTCSSTIYFLSDPSNGVIYITTLLLMFLFKNLF